MRFILLCVLLMANAHAAYRVQKLVSNNKSQVINAVKVDAKINERKVLRNIREMIAERVPTPDVTFIEELIPEGEASEKIKNLAYKKSFTPYIAGSEVREIIKQGKDSNRIILTVLGDGYTEAEREKFFEDVDRIVGDLFREVTFKSYLKLFNIYAVFVPSKDSGITDLTSKDTAFGLYRSPKGSKRGIMPGNRSAIENALKLIPAYTDYPIIIANDDFYGGLGGRYAITTRSHNSGSMVLRHELGHNFSNVGEEYDGGQVYSGANFSSNSNVSWAHWINGNTEVHRAKFLTGSYVWQKLYDENFKKEFNFPDSADYFYSLKLSSVGWEHADDVHVYLDGERLELDGVYTEDRSFFYTKNVNLTQGAHKIEIKDHSHDGNNVLAYANGYAFPKSYNFDAGVIGAFNVFDSSGRERGFRPTHDDCLMRDMRSMVFCPVDQENIWLRFFKKMNVIESIEETSDSFKLTLLDLGPTEIKWYKKSFWGTNEELTHLNNKLEVKKSELKSGKYIIKASLSHPEVIKEKITTEREIKL
jgi:hypothetical protein